MSNLNRITSSSHPCYSTITFPTQNSKLGIPFIRHLLGTAPPSTSFLKRFSYLIKVHCNFKRFLRGCIKKYIQIKRFFQRIFRGFSEVLMQYSVMLINLTRPQKDNFNKILNQINITVLDLTVRNF